MRTLLSEPDPATRSILASLLEENGHSPAVLDDGTGAALAIESGKAELVVLGPGFTASDQVALTAGLKAKPDRFVPVVIVGREGTKDAWIAALDGGAEDYFAMPVDGEELAARLRALARVKVLNEELRHLAAVQEQIVFTMSHDIQTPLVGIRGAVQNLRRGLVGPLTTEQEEYLELVEDATRRLSEQTSSACRSARRRRQSGADAREPVDLQKATETAIAGLRPTMMRRQLRVRLNAAPETPLALGDRATLVRVIANLLDNAVKFSPTDGQISVELSGWREGEEYMVLATVSDEGLGIPESEQDRIFAGGHGAEERGTPGARTTGLGLALCRERVESMGGKIWLESNDGEGASFHVLMPAALPVRGAV